MNSTYDCLIAGGVLGGEEGLSEDKHSRGVVCLDGWWEICFRSAGSIAVLKRGGCVL